MARKTGFVLPAKSDWRWSVSMKHLSLSGWLLALMCCVASYAGLAHPVMAMENYSEVLRDQYGRAIGGATVLVYLTGTNTLAVLYSDNGVTTKTNGFLTEALTGSFNFYAANGVYDLVFQYPGTTFDPSLSRRIALFDVNDYSAS